MIPCVESQYTQEYIANVFWRLHIAKVSSITLIPYLKNNEIYNIAYILIDDWCDSESAYNFIQRVKNPEREARIIHNSDEDWWPVQINTHNDGKMYVGTYTVTFDSEYFQRDVSSCSDDELEYPIKGLHNNNYTVDDALERIWFLNQVAEDFPPSSTRFYDIKSEIKHLETELKIHNATLNSHNVTLRDGQLSHILPKPKLRRDVACTYNM